MEISKGTGLAAKMRDIKAFISMWVQDDGWYCNMCGTPYTGIRGQWQCDSKMCDAPQIGRNIDHLRGALKQNKMYREELIHNDYASSEGGHMRLAVSMPPQLLKDLESYYRSQYDEPLFDDQKTLRRFMKEFPQFSIARRI